MSALIAMLTDFGLTDGYVGVMKGVILGIAPQTQLVDITHEVPPQDVLTGSWLLHTVWRYFPEETIFLCVVDPGVGTGRQAVALRIGSRYFVGPDNGLFSYVMSNAQVEQAVALDQPRYHLPNPSATFHGRDIFSPAAAHLASGVALSELGSSRTPQQLVTLDLPVPTRDGVQLRAHIIHVDRFGNLITDLGPSLTGAYLSTSTATLLLSNHRVTAKAHTFADAPEGELCALRDSSGHLAIALRNGSAAARVRMGRGDSLIVMGLPTEISPIVENDQP